MALIQKKYYKPKNKSPFFLRPGLSLVELITSFAIIGVLALMLGSVYLASFKLFNAETTTIDLQTNAILAIDDLQDTIRVAKRVETCTIGGCGGPGSDEVDKISLIYEPLDSNNKPMNGNASRDNYCAGYPVWDPGNPLPFWDHIWYEKVGTDLIKTTYTYSTLYNAHNTASNGECRSARIPNCTGILNNLEACRNDRIIVTNVSDLTFTYYNGNNKIDPPYPPDRNCVTSIDVSITLSKDTIRAGAVKIKATQTEKIKLVNFVSTSECE